MNAVFDILRNALADPGTGWSLGAFGAIAEFHRDADEPAEIVDGDGLRTVTTARGAIAVYGHADVRLIPYESLSTIPTAWSHGVMVCLPDTAAAMDGPGGVADRGADTDALMPADPAARLFDLGFGIAHIRAGVRTADADLIAALRAADGTAFLDLPPDTVRAIKQADPVRVFASRLGRIEVVQAIPASDGVTPMGPHTHVMPELLGRGRGQAANVPVPDGWAAALAFYPPHPIRTADGTLKSFDKPAHDAFQALMAAHAPKALMHAKQTAWKLLDQGTAPADDAVPTTRHARIAFRVALRQWEHVNGTNDLSAAWRTLCDPTREADVA